MLENIEQKDEPVTFAQDYVPDVIDGPTTKAHYSTVDAGANTSMTDEATSSVHGSAAVSASITSISENSGPLSKVDWTSLLKSRVTAMENEQRHSNHDHPPQFAPKVHVRYRAIRNTHDPSHKC